MLELKFKKHSYSENVVRQALYWMSHISSWQLTDNEVEWIIEFNKNSADVVHEFNRLLNDYLLREKLDKQTRVIRESITLAVLESVERKLS
ncbi:His-Xaa-Ser system protein HxsD [Vibrio navarrensis]|uniref:His-Xaa-Ser system protein HxsD n=1 Tax=Vibrio navarrensis TaxID=29495 RepID=UPI00186A319B|nr:His-Xaa-Ser system protein HxsD [Vibrio navarrensis]MBE4619794.1 His-Xaa-Ser system protein HxsD [Vibrio navarrensis]